MSQIRSVSIPAWRGKRFPLHQPSPFDVQCLRLACNEAVRRHAASCATRPTCAATCRRQRTPVQACRHLAEIQHRTPMSARTTRGRKVRGTTARPRITGSAPQSVFTLTGIVPAPNLIVMARPSSSWPGLSGPPIDAPAGTGGPDKPGHDEVEGGSHVSSQGENALGRTYPIHAPKRGRVATRASLQADTRVNICYSLHMKAPDCLLWPMAACRWAKLQREADQNILSGGSHRHTRGTVTPIMSPSRTIPASRSSSHPSVPAGRSGSTIQR